MDLSVVVRLAPPGAVLVAMADTGQELPLPPEEAALVAGAVEKRRRDFALGRSCACAALAQIGHADAVVGRGAGGAPAWPNGVIGSITHTQGFAAALAATAGPYQGLGIDAERSNGMDEKLFARLFTPPERGWLAGLPEARRKCAATLLFSAKEAWFKAHHPATGQRLNFQQVEITPGEGDFSARRLDGASGPVTGRFVLLDDLVVTVIWW